MAITKVLTSRNCMRSIRYVKGSERNRKTVLEGARYIDADAASRQMLSHLKVHGKEQGYLHTYNVILSFDKKDFDLSKEADRERFDAYVNDYVEEAFPDNPVYWGAHVKDGYEQPHVHMLVCATNIHGKNIRGREASQKHRLSKITDDLCRKHGLSVIDRDLSQGKSDKSAVVQMRKADKYSYKDDLRARLDDAMAQGTFTNKDEFKAYMAEHHAVDVMFSNKDNISYKFMSAEDKEIKLRASRLEDNKNDKRYSRDAIFNQFDVNSQRQAHRGTSEAHREALVVDEGFDKAKQKEAEKRAVIEREAKRKAAFINQHSPHARRDDGSLKVHSKHIGLKKYEDTPKVVRDKYFEIIQERMTVPVSTVDGRKRRRTYQDVLSEAHSLVNQEQQIQQTTQHLHDQGRALE